jgi:pyruvate dehydrogenase E2 component (dihydrolipoamide acetyltransferase)
MPIDITMPKLSDTMEEGTILKWHVAAGDRVRRGDIIAEVETDKAAMEMEAFDDGVVSALRVAEGETAKIGVVIAVLEVEPEQGSEPGVQKPATDTTGKSETAVAEAPQEKPPKEIAPKEIAPKEEVPKEEVPKDEVPKEATPRAERSEAGAQATFRRVVHSGGRRPPVSPAARRLAEDRGVDLAQLRGSGPGGRIVLAEVEKGGAQERPGRGKPAGKPEAAGEPPAGKSVKIRRIVARKMTEAWDTIPHFYVTVAVDMTDIIRFRKDLGVSINDFIVAASARSLREHPWVNSHFKDGEAQEQEQVNIALAVATERGLYNPVLHDCAGRSLKDLSRMTTALAERAHHGKLTQEDLAGGTFTISNMGMLGVESFSAIVTPPQVAVLAVGTARGELVVDEHGEPAIAPMLRLTLSADHRVIDGADAAEFLGTLKSYLEAPVVLVAGENGKERG